MEICRICEDLHLLWDSEANEAARLVANGEIKWKSDRGPASSGEGHDFFDKRQWDQA
jgi:hypothetical protein